MSEQKSWDELYTENVQLRELAAKLQDKLVDQPSALALSAANGHLNMRVLQAEKERDVAAAELAQIRLTNVSAFSSSAVETQLRSQVSELQEELRMLQKQLEDSDRF